MDETFHFSATWFFGVTIKRKEGETDAEAAERAAREFFRDPLQFITPEDIQNTAEIEADDPGEREDRVFGR